MNFANLVGMYKVALNRCIDVIACNEENSSVEEIIDAVDCTLTMIDGNEDLLALLTLDDTYRLISANADSTVIRAIYASFIYLSCTKTV